MAADCLLLHSAQCSDALKAVGHIINSIAGMLPRAEYTALLGSPLLDHSQYMHGDPSSGFRR